MKDTGRAKNKKYVHMRPRLSRAAEMIKRVGVFADIGCDHGRLGIGLLQNETARLAILSEISEKSLAKARSLAKITGMDKRIDFRVGDGLGVLNDGEAEAFSVCGMGGMLIRKILEEANTPLAGAKFAVLQPMRGVEELREYLFGNNYRIIEDAIAVDNDRMYQIFSVERGEDKMPEGWPEDCFYVGFKAAGDPLFKKLVEKMLAECGQKLIEAKGTKGEAVLSLKADRLKTALNYKP